jgi:hypothetical protein
MHIVCLIYIKNPIIIISINIEQNKIDNSNPIKLTRMNIERDIQIRRHQTSELIRCMEYPFEFLRNGEYEKTTKQIPGHNSEDIGEFPDNISEYYWISEGENDEKPWITLCRLTNGVYVFYKGECDYTGFDCQGNMEIYSSKDYSVLIRYAMSIDDYNKYYKDTS